MKPFAQWWVCSFKLGNFLFPKSHVLKPCPHQPYLWPFPHDGLHLGFLAQFVGAQGLNTCWEHVVFEEALLSQTALPENEEILPLILEGLCGGALPIPPVPLSDHTVTEEFRQQVGHGECPGRGAGPWLGPLPYSALSSGPNPPVNSLEPI